MTVICGKMKNNDLEAHIGIPDGFKVKGGDGRAISSWNEVKKMQTVIFCLITEPVNRSCALKTRYSQKNRRKPFWGFKTGWNILRMCVHINFVTAWKSEGRNQTKFHLCLFQ